ncbi:MAG: hypothetical protein U0X39_02995 [Bacteroidales bacterium]
MKTRGLLSAIVLSMMIVLSACSDKEVLMPQLVTLAATQADITATTAILKGEIKVLGNQNISSHGIEVSKSMLFTNSILFAATGTAAAGSFEVTATGLEPGTVYYFKAYVTINTAQVYSDEYLTFTTKPL